MNIITELGRYASSTQFGWVPQLLLARPFNRTDNRRVAIIYERNRIAYSQIFPFVRHASALEARHQIQLRFFTVDTLDSLNFSNFDDVLFQFWFQRDVATFHRIFDKASGSSVRIVAFLDSYAHNNMRFAGLIDPHVQYYLKKSIFRNTDWYERRVIGDTNLTDYYNNIYGIEDEVSQFTLPDGFTDKLRLSPNFFTDPKLERAFLTTDIDALVMRRRDIDLHARLGSAGSGWYAEMRAKALQTVAELESVRSVSDGLVDRKTFFAELGRSKICFSPFGYGEVCWRDLEAFVSGAVLLKPSMDHLRVLPDLYEPNITYIPTKWDFSDVKEKVAWILSNPSEAEAITREAFSRVRRYLERQIFIEDMQFLFQE